MTDVTYSDCRTETGKIVGLIDGMISMARFVAQHLSAKSPDLDPAVSAALQDFSSDEDVNHMLGQKTSRLSQLDAIRTCQVFVDNSTPSWIIRQAVQHVWLQGQTKFPNLFDNGVYIGCHYNLFVNIKIAIKELDNE